MKIRTIAIIGSGTMGSGIAQMAAACGYGTLLYDLNEESLKKARSIIDKNLEGGLKRNKITEEEKKNTLDRIKTVSDINELKADLVIEAIVEQLEPKVQVFKKMHEINGSECILATNTSSIPISKIAANIPHPKRVVGMHFFNPAHIMKLVEIILGAATDKKIAETVFNLAEEMGKKAVYAKDSPGFIVNRVARHFYVESMKVLEEQVATHEQIDRLIENNGFRMGPFRLMDLIGVDTNFSVTSRMFESFHYDSKFRPSRIQEQKVNAGLHGRKSGEGFYKYSD